MLKIIDDVEKKIDKAIREADKIAMNFVLEKLEDPAKALDDFIEKYTDD